MGGSRKNKKNKQKRSITNDPAEDSSSSDFKLEHNPSETSSSSSGFQLYCNDVELEHLIVMKLIASYSRTLPTTVTHGDRREAAANSVSEKRSGCEDREQARRDLLTFVQESLSAMVRNLSEARPSLSSGDVRWCLFMANFDLEVAKTLELQAKTSDGKYVLSNAYISMEEVSYLIGLMKRIKTVDDNNTKCSIWDRVSDKNLDKFSEKQNREDPRPSYQDSHLRRNVEAFAVMFREEIKETPEETRALEDLYRRKVPETRFEIDDSRMVDLALAGLGEENPEVIGHLVDEIKLVKESVKERKEWALKRILESAKRLGNDLLELKALKMEHRVDDPLAISEEEDEERSMKIFESRQRALGEMTHEAIEWNEVAKSMENTNAEILAEIEAYKLSWSESDEKLKQVLKEEKRLTKKNSALEKQNKKVEIDVGEHREKFSALQQELGRARQARDEVQVMLRQEDDAKEAAINRLKEEQKSKKEAESSIRTRRREMHQEVNDKRWKYKCYIELLERKIANVGISQEGSVGPHQLPDYLFSWESESSKGNGVPTSSCDRACMYCMVNEASVVLLPCAHQVLCANCNEGHSQYAKSTCPCCKSSVEERIHVFGLTS